ncbi:DUF4240 domain-containing protein [Blastococcus sp. SYSU D01042]
MRLFRRPLDEGEFWALIGRMGGRGDDQAVENLTEALRGRRRKDVVGFQEQLARVLFDLDREVLADQPVRFRDDPSDEDPVPLSDDGFLYLRAGLVVRGRETCERVLRDPTVLAQGEWEECEELLYVAEEILGQEVDTTVSYETGSNAQYWTPRPEPESEPWDQGLRLVSVDAHDLSDPIEAGRSTADGGWESFTVYYPPGFLRSDVLHDVSTDLARIVTTNGGLPEHLGVDHVAAVIEFADTWRTEPEVGEPARSEIGVHDEIRVRVAVSSDSVRGWRAEERRRGLAALGASCVLAVLPDDHPARPQLEELRRAGAQLLPT